MTDTGCVTWDTKEDKEMSDEWEERTKTEQTAIQGVPQEELDRVMPQVEEKLQRLNEEEVKSKEDLVEQSQKAEHLKIDKVNPKDYPKAVQAIPVKGFDASGRITDSEMKKVIRKDPLVQIPQRFFPKRTVSIESIEYSGGREVKYGIGEDGKPRVNPILGETRRDPKTGETKKIIIHEHRLKDAVKYDFIKEKEIEKASPEKKNEAIKKAILSTCAHERRGHMFTLEMLSEETKSKAVNLFYSIKERGARFITEYAKTDSGEYLAEGWGIYEVEPKLLKKEDPQLYNLIQEIEKECKSFIETSKKLILVRGE